MRITLLILSLLLFVSSCANNNIEQIEEDSKPVDSTIIAVCDTLPTSFASNIRPIIADNCSFSGCHPGYVDYNNLITKVNEGSFEQRVIVEQNMPPSYSQGPTSLTANELDSLCAWIKAGALNN